MTEIENEELKTIKVEDGNIVLFDLIKLNHIRNNAIVREKEIDDFYENRDLIRNNILKELVKMTDLSFQFDCKLKTIFNKIEITIKKDRGILTLETYSHFYDSDFFGSFGGHFCGCDTEETLVDSDDDILIEEDEIIEEDVKVNPLSALISDFDVEGPIYQFIMKNYDKIYNKPFNKKDIYFKQILYNILSEDSKTILENLEIDKVYKTQIDTDKFIYIKYLDNKDFYVYKKIDDNFNYIENYLNYDGNKFIKDHILNSFLTIKKTELC